MRILHKLRLSKSDAVFLDWTYRATQCTEIPRLKEAAENAVYRLVAGILSSRFKGREDEVPGTWKWSYAGRTLYISAE